jgi:GNAT superfamily N-acetyltransferase
VAAKWSGHGRLYPGPFPQRLHITLITDPELLQPVVEAARSLGAESLAFGMDQDHLFPGLPQISAPPEGPGWELGTALEAKMTELGFVKGSDTVVDIERDLDGYEPYPGCLEPIAAEGMEVRTALPQDEQAMEAFFVETFPGRWRHDVMAKFRRGEGSEIDLLVQGSDVLGFSCTQSPRSQLPMGGAVWKASLAHTHPRWGALGPIGISSRVRGKGLGGAILGASLQRMSREGARQTIIDWTSLVAFYGMHGFKVSRRYQYWILDLKSQAEGAA